MIAKTSTKKLNSRARLTVLAMVVSLCTGCASLTNPVANGIPARLVPDELLGTPKSTLEPIPLTWLRRRPDDNYRLATGDVLGVFIDGVLGEQNQLPPINFPDAQDLPPSVGFPIPIRQNGTVPLPLVSPVKVDGLTIEEAEQAILKAYTVDKEIIKEDESRILVTLIRPRRAKILVVREDSPSQRVQNQNFNVFGRAAPIAPPRGQGQGFVIEVPATEADVLSVLAQSGGLPGPNAANEVVIQRGYNRSNFSAGADGILNDDFTNDIQSGNDEWCTENGCDENGRPRYVKIPLRLPCNQPPPFSPDDVKLASGDIVFIPAIDAQVYYTGGLLPSREVGIPRDYDLRVVEALLRVGGPLINGGINANNLSGGIVGSGIGNPSPSLLTVLRRTPDGGQAIIRVDLNRAVREPRENILVQAGDVLILQETPQEAATRYFTSIFNVNIFGEIFASGSAAVTGTGNIP